MLKNQIRWTTREDYIENYIHKFCKAESLLVCGYMRHMWIPVLDEFQLHIHDLLRTVQRIISALHRVAALCKQTPRSHKRYIRDFLLIQLHPVLSRYLHLTGATGKLIHAVSMLVVADVLFVVNSVLELCADVVHQLLVRWFYLLQNVLHLLLVRVLLQLFGWWFGGYWCVKLAQVVHKDFCIDLTLII